jgi:L-threonylcarbamoyladenylate synthase
MNQIEQAVKCLQSGQVVAIPTETVYGLAADASSREAVAEIYRLKGRPSNHPVIVHFSDWEAALSWALDIRPWALELAKTHWPGPLTLVCKRQPWVGDWLTGGQDTVGLRVPNHPLTLELLRQFGGGLAAPSANRFGRVSPTTAQHVRDEFGPTLPILDGGPCQVGIESTIIDATSDQPRILRPGHIRLDDCPQTTPDPTPQSDSIPIVPGSLSSHYAPAIPCRIWTGQPLAPGCGLIVFGKPPYDFPSEDINVCDLSQDPERAAAGLYQGLRRLETSNQELWIQAPPAGAQWDGIRDRVQRATYSSQ